MNSSIDATLQLNIWFFHEMTNRTTVAIVVDDSVCSVDEICVIGFPAIYQWSVASEYLQMSRPCHIIFNVGI